MQYDRYTKEDLEKVLAKTESDLIMNSGVPYYDIAAFNAVFQKTCNDHWLMWFDKEGVLNFGTFRPSDKMVHNNVRIDNLREECEKRNIYLCRWLYQRLVMIFDDTIVCIIAEWDPAEKKEIGRLDSVLTRKSLDYVKKMLDFLVQGKPDFTKSCGIALSGNYGINVRMSPITEDYSIDVEKNYNDDLPYEEILKHMNEKAQGLFLFYGRPGSGKTTLIKHLITVVDKPFIYMDPSLLKSTSDTHLIDFLDSYKDSVLILEDCERLIKSRENGSGNGNLGTLLNLTDGIIGNLVKVKFICTFNCPEEEIDKALLRKGRLKVKYEFKELCLEKTQALLPSATKPMTLADIYNANETNDFSKKEKAKIGFDNPY